MADPKSVQDQAKICLNRGKSRIKGIKDLRVIKWRFSDLKNKPPKKSRKDQKWLKISVFKLKITFFFLNLGFLVFFDELEGLFQDLKDLKCTDYQEYSRKNNSK